MESKEKVQHLLERQACKSNGGVCESYSYCKFCKEPKNFVRESSTPCADAYIDMSYITNLLKNYKENKEKIAIIKERINLWKRIQQEHAEDLEYLTDWFLDLKKSDTYGMPKAIGMYISTVEEKTIKKEEINNTIYKFIKIQEERNKTLTWEINKLEKAIKNLKEEERFILDCKYLEMHLKTKDIIVSVYNTYKKTYGTEAIKKKIASIKRKIYKNMQKK